MDFFEIGKTKVPCKVNINKRLKGKRLSVTPDGLVIEVPSSNFSDLESFLRKKEEWIFNQWYELGHRTTVNPWPENFVSGAKVMFYDRFEMLNVEVQDSKDVKISYSIRGFNVIVPINLPTKFRSEVVMDSFVDFFKNSLKKEFNSTVAMYSNRLDIKGTEVSFIDRKDVWALCEEDGSIKLDWKLAFLPKNIVEYIIVHELCHMKERNHGKSFWNLLATILPDYQESKDYLSKKLNLSI